jgi:hypothetical protein
MDVQMRRESTRRRTIFVALALGSATVLVTGVSSCSDPGWDGKRSKRPPYSLARSMACWRADGYRVSRPHHRAYLSPRYRRVLEFEIRGHHDHEYATFAPNNAVAWYAAHDNGGGFWNSDYGPPPVPVRNFIFGRGVTFRNRRIRSCLRTSRD